MGATRQVSLRLTGALLQRLDREARLRKASRTSLVREALEHYLGSEEEDADHPFARVKDLIGSVRGSGPRDLARRHAYYLRKIFRKGTRKGGHFDIVP